jgi:MYXO-CTERM domain-containing protein
MFSAFVLAGAIASPAMSFAQTNPSSNDERATTAVNTDSATVTDRDDHRNWGWLGLLGLAGLAGLKRRDREKVLDDKLRTRQTI